MFLDIGLGNFRLADLTIIEDDQLIQHNKLALLEILVKHIYDRDFSAVIDYVIKAFRIALSQHINQALIQGAIYYLLSGREREELDPLIEKLKQNIPEYGGTIMTYAEELRQEGMQKGLQLGEQKGIQLGEQKAQNEIAIRMLNSGIDPEKVSQIVGISVDKLQKTSM